MSYNAIVSRIKTRPHPNADKLLLGTCLGNQVVVGLNTPDGDLGVFFPTDGKLSREMCLTNNLYNRSALSELGIPTTDDGHYGFFDSNRRVRAQRFRGERSDGIWLPLDSLEWTGYDINQLKEGDTITELSGQLICEKYYTPATIRAMRGGTRPTRKENPCFPKHDDTAQFRYVADHIATDAIIYITEKMHGTSGRYGLVMDEQHLTGWRKLLAYIANHSPVLRGYRYLSGSRNVIIDDSKPGFYGTNDFRHDVVKNITLHKGEILFFEIVGSFQGDGRVVPIMPPQPTDKLKEVAKVYGPQMNYTYGTAPGQCKMYVYKIALTNEDGDVVEQPWSYVVRRCKELGLETVPLLAGPIVAQDIAETRHLPRQTNQEALRLMVESLTNGPSTLDSRHIREGVVVRVEHADGIQHIKNKSFEFGVLEGYVKTDESYVDLEEIA